MKNQNENEMTEKKMWSLLSQLVDTEYFPAIQKLVGKKDIETVTVLATNDPFKEPTKSAQAQGIRIGIYFIPQACISEKKRIEEEIKEKRESNAE